MTFLKRGAFRNRMFFAPIKEDHAEKKFSGDPIEVMSVTRTNNKNK